MLEMTHSTLRLPPWKAPEVETSLTTVATASADNADTVSDEEQVEVGISAVSTGGVSSAGTGLQVYEIVQEEPFPSLIFLSELPSHAPS